MTGWLPFSISATLLCALIFSFTYFFLYLRNKKIYLAVWLTAWNVDVIRLAFMLLPILIEMGEYNTIFLAVALLALVTNGILILYGWYIFLNKKFPLTWIFLYAAVSAFIALSGFSITPITWGMFIAFICAGWMNIWTAITILRVRHLRVASGLTTGISIGIWGNFKIYYPVVLLFAPSLMMWGYLIDSILFIIIAISILSIYFRFSQKRYKFSEINYSLLVESSGEAIIIIKEGKLIFVNKKTEEISGYKQEELLTRSITDFIHQDDKETLTERHMKRLQGMELSPVFLFRIIHKSGETRWVESNATVCTIDGETATLNFLRDITDQKNAEEALSESQRRLSTLMSNLPGMAYRRSNISDFPMEFVSNGCKALTGYTTEHMVGDSGLSFTNIIHRKDIGKVRKILQRAVDRKQSFGTIYRINSADDEEKWVWDGGRTVSDNEGNVIALEGFINDITGPKNTEEALRQSLLKFEKTFQATPVWVSLASIKEGRYLEVNEALLSDTGYRREEVIGRQWRELDTWVNPEDREHIMAVIMDQGGIRNMEVQRKARSGEIIDALCSAEFLLLEDQEVMISVTQNITALKNAQEDRDHLQNQLTQAQKMESVGRLAGGVAHDYNNMLTVIMGRAEVALSMADKETPYYTHIQEILNAAQRSADITKQLLAFARKQTIDPKVLNLNETLDGMLKMLKHLIGEDIELSFKPGQDIWAVIIDPSQLDQILVNLCVNARDAIEETGKITIETENIALDYDYTSRHKGSNQGEYVLLSFKDNGIGIDKDTLQNIFEPFFTTKGPGKGTGLGLSTVYGIIKQNHGFINVESDSGKGTVFQIYLPREKLQSEVEKEKKVIGSPRGQGETILVVEDDKAVIDVCETILSHLDYNVITAGGPLEAIDIVEKYSGDIHLLLSDVVMPGMNGRDMSRKIIKIRPEIKVLFMSGYTSNGIVHEGILYKGLNFIKKPFTRDKLAKKVQEILSQN
ncbi:MAG: PAS domain S-box protein [Desulfobacteraceae bacterium]|jgi:PAS domain S-box-containing protein